MSEAEAKRMHAALYGYTSSFNAEAVLTHFAQGPQDPEPGVFKNFIGTKIAAYVFPEVLDKMVGMVEPRPAPGNWHADIAEWAGALRSVLEANDIYRIVEVGCGWGCWINNTGVAARKRGLKLDLIGIEADEHHLENARKTLDLNGFRPDEYSLHHGIAGAKAGKAVFPTVAGREISWGNKAIFDPSEKDLECYEKDPSWTVLECKPLSLLSSMQPIDLLHIDIQGSELEYIAGNIADIQKYVRRVLIGSHSREIEGQLMEFFRKRKWKLEVERPAVLNIVDSAPEIRIDGVQLWANPNLVGANDASVIAQENEVRSPELRVVTEKVQASIDHVVGISWPRSGHHLLGRLLQLYFGGTFNYCAPYPKKQGCCGTVPCQKRDSVHFTKSHDFQLDVAQVDGLKYLIQYREFVSSVVSNFELYIMDGGEDSMRGFQRFASSQFDHYLNFQKKWVFSDFAKGQFLLDYDMLVSKPSETLARVAQFFAPKSAPDPERIEWAVSVVAGETVERQRIIPKPKVGVHASRDVRQFRYYDQKLFETLSKLTLSVAEVQDKFQKLLKRKANPDNMLDFQAFPSPEALEQYIRQSEEFKRKHHS